MTTNEALKMYARQYGQPLKGVLLEAVADLEEQATEIASLKSQLAECKKDAERLNEAFEHITRIRDYQRINDWQMMGISIREADDWLVACKSTISQKEESK